jgi:hypothetical protein
MRASLAVKDITSPNQPLPSSLPSEVALCRKELADALGRNLYFKTPAEFTVRHIVITKKGKDFGLEFGEPSSLPLRVWRLVEVTGIRRVDETTRDVEFSFRKESSDSAKLLGKLQEPGPLQNQTLKILSI